MIINEVEKIFEIKDFITGEKHLGHRGCEYTDIDIARFWAIKKSLDLKATIALYDGNRILNIYQHGKPIKDATIKHGLKSISYIAGRRGRSWTFLKGLKPC